MGRFFTSMPANGISRRLALPVAVWTFVLTLVFGAVVPIGLPDTLVHGPTFNPATPSVALAGKRGDPGSALVQGLRGAKPDGAAGNAAMPALAPALASILILLGGCYARTPANILRPVRCGARGARSPPGRRC